MRVVVDANVVAAALIDPIGFTAGQFERPELEWVAPALLGEELREKAEVYALKARCSPREWARRAEALLARIGFIGDDALQAAMAHPWVKKAETVDVDDAAYVAALVASGARYLWTFDKALHRAFPDAAVSVVPRAAGETP